MSLLGILLTVTDSASVAEVEKEAAEVKSWTEQLSSLPFDQVIEKLLTGAVDLVVKLLIAIIVFYVGKLIINRIHKSVKKILLHRQVERSLSLFILSVLKVTLLFILIIIVISIVGIETSSFIALFASAGVAIGMALSGTLQNFAGGVLILLLKPYKVGDYIEVQGYEGTVKEIQIFNTILNTIDNKSIFIPNGSLSTGSLKNYNKEDYRRVDWTITISYGDDYNVAKKAILDIVGNDNRIVKKYIEDDREERSLEAKREYESGHKTDMALPDTKLDKKPFIKRIFNRHNRSTHDAIRQQDSQTNTIIVPKVDRSPFVALGALSSSSVDIIVRVWTPSQYFWGVFYDMNEKFYTELPKAGINFPFPQLDVHLAKQ